MQIWDSVPLDKYLGFLEEIAENAVKFKEEHAFRRETERLRRRGEDDDDDYTGHYENRIIRGRTRLNAHPEDVQRDIISKKKSEVNLHNSGSKGGSSIAYKRTAMASGEFTHDDSIENSHKFYNDINYSQDNMGQTGAFTLPSIFNNKKFEKELPNLELNFVDKDYLKINANILDLKKVKERNQNIFKTRSSSYHFNESQSLMQGEFSRSKMDHKRSSNYNKNLRDLKTNKALGLTRTLRSNRVRDRKSTRLNSSHRNTSRMPSSA